MNIRHIRNATAVIEYGGKRVLIDPMLSDKGALNHFQIHRDKMKTIHL